MAPKADPAATVAGDTGRLVQGQQAGVLEHDRGLQRVHEALRRRALLAGVGQLDRRDPHLVTRFQAPLGLDPPAVHPHLAGAQQLVDQAARRSLQVAQQEIVDALAVAVFRHAHGARAGGRRGLGRRVGHRGHAPVGLPVLGLLLSRLI
jgi:hypothetical protein